MKDNQWRPEDSSPAHEENSSEDAESQGTQHFDEAASGSFKTAAGPDATTAGFTGASPAASPTAGAVPGAPAGEPPHVPSPLDSTQMAESPASGTRIADDPLAGKQPADDPMGSDPLTLDRKNASRPRSA